MPANRPFAAAGPLGVVVWVACDELTGRELVEIVGKEDATVCVWVEDSPVLVELPETGFCEGVEAPVVPAEEESWANTKQ